MELTLERYLQVEGLREELERRARRERAEYLHCLGSRLWERAVTPARVPLQSVVCG